MRSERRLHPLSFVFSIGSTLRSFLLPALLLLVASRRMDRLDNWLLLLAIPYVAVSIYRYLTFRYRLDPDEMVIRTGLLFRNERHVPYARIHNIGSIRNPMHRLLGVAEATVETAGGQEPEARLQVLSLEALEQMRRFVFERKRGVAGAARAGEDASGRPGGGPPGEEPAAAGVEAAREVLHMGPADLVLHGIVDNRGMVVVGAAAGLAWELGLLGDGWFGDARSIGRTFRETLGTGAPLAGAARLAAFVVAALALLRLFSIGWALVKMFDFRLERAGRELRLSYGLFTKLATAVPLDRIQMVTVRERPLHRLLGRAEVRARSAGGTPEQEGGAVVSRQRLAPLIRREDLARFLAEIVPGMDLDSVPWRPVDPRARRRLLRCWLLLSAVVTAAAAGVLGAPGLLAAALMAPLSVLNARLQAANMHWALTGGFVLYRSGWLWRTVSLARLQKVQAVALAESPFDRRYGMGTLRVDTAGAHGARHGLHVPYLDMPTARGLFDHLVARAASTEFRW